MKLKEVTKKIALTFGTACLVLMAFACPIASMPPVQAAVPETAQPNDYCIEYKYMIRDHKVYKRLYNSTIHEWVDPDWIYVRDWPYDWLP